MKPVLILTLAAAVATLPVAKAQNASSPSLQIDPRNRTITVSASDHAEADPDTADLHVGFTAYGMSLKAAYKTASDTSNGIVKAMQDAGAKPSEIQSQTQSVSRLSDYEVKEQKGMRYSVQQSWTVSIAPKDAAIILDAAVQAGANQSGEITWRMKNNVALETEAIHLATERARAIAKEMASSLGLKLGLPLYVTNMNEGQVRPMIMTNRAMVAEFKAAAPAPLSIQAQRVESNATVQIVFAVE